MASRGDPHLSPYVCAWSMSLSLPLFYDGTDVGPQLGPVNESGGPETRRGKGVTSGVFTWVEGPP